MSNKICFHCTKDIVDPLDYNLYPLDIPYINLFFHKSCFRELGGYDKMPVYCTEHIEKVYNRTITSIKGEKTGKNGRKTQKKAV
jgi:hypothetical protein